MRKIRRTTSCPRLVRSCTLREPGGPGVRLDSGVYPGWNVPLDYDPMLAKLIVHAHDRPLAIGRALRGLAEYAVTGVTTNIPFFRDLLNDAEFQAGRLHTGFLDEFMARRPQPEPSEGLDFMAAVVSAVHARMASPDRGGANHNGASRWVTVGRKDAQR